LESLRDAIDRSRTSTGALKVAGDRVSGLLFLDDGQLCFGLISGTNAVADDGGGIPPSAWLEAMATPAADFDFAAALVLAGVPENQVSRYAWRSIGHTVLALLANNTIEVSHIERHSPFGTMFRFDPAIWFGETAVSDRPHLTAIA
ncbi:MAG: hypothetical protein OEW30_21560, partial [Acidimicrobiia bacterium]|nr:hypothetical protein [Acidimicrobiia bacterium]